MTKNYLLATNIELQNTNEVNTTERKRKRRSELDFLRTYAYVSRLKPKTSRRKTYNSQETFNKVMDLEVERSWEFYLG